MKKRFLSVAVGVLAVSAMLAGCGSGAAKSDGPDFRRFSQNLVL